MIPAVMLAAAGPEDWVPVRWPGGPLEVLRRSQTSTAPVDAAVGQVLHNWYHPRTLTLLENTPVNCLLVTWSTGAERSVESEQWKLVAAYARAAHQKGIAVVGLLYPGADPDLAAASAVDAGLDGLALEGDFRGNPTIVTELRRALCARKCSAVVIPLGSQEWLRPDSAWPILGTGEGVAPGIRVLSESDAAVATPTSEPWIDSNIWLIRSLRAWGGERPVWLGYELANPAEADYARAIADAAVAGGRWVVSLGDELRAGLWHERAEALAIWRRIAVGLSFFEQHREWRGFAPVGPLGIVQDLTGPHRVISGENLNLITRRRIPYRLIDRARLARAALEGLRAVVATNLAPPTGVERELLDAFVENGGLLVAGPSWRGAAPGSTGYILRQLGRGTILAYTQNPTDPEALSKDLPDLLGKENLLVRLFNVPSVLTQVSAGPRGAPLLLQLVNYASGPAESITVRVAGAYRSARLFRPEAPPLDLKIDKSDAKIELTIDSVAVCAALLLEE
jgi:hypothetical protein